MSREAVRRLVEYRLLSRQELRCSRLAEDQLTALLLRSTGLRLGDFATGSFPIGVRWRGLPCSPEELIGRGKKVTHSTRFYGAMTEEEIRAFFRAQRR